MWVEDEDWNSSITHLFYVGYKEGLYCYLAEMFYVC